MSLKWVEKNSTLAIVALVFNMKFVFRAIKGDKNQDFGSSTKMILNENLSLYLSLFFHLVKDRNLYKMQVMFGKAHIPVSFYAV